MSAAPRHQCMVYQGSPSKQLPALAATIQQKLQDNFRCLYLNSPTMVAGMRSALAALGVDVAHEVAKASLILSSDREHLDEGRFDGERMLRSLQSALEHALNDQFQGLWATGDMSWQAGFHTDLSTLLDYEWRLEELFRGHPELQGICQYHADTLPRESLKAGVISHQSFFINETLSRLNIRYVRAEVPADHVAVTAEVDDLLDELCPPSSAN